MRSSRLCCSLWEVWWGFTASRFRLSNPCRASSRSAVVENNEAEDRSPIEGIGIISRPDMFSIMSCKLTRDGRDVPELKGTTEEKGEYGSASSTVGGLVLVRLVPFCAELPFGRFPAPRWAA